jgi:catalase
MVPLVIAPHGGKVDGLPVQRTFATARSVEFDALLLAAAPAPAPDAVPARDDKAGATAATALDPRVRLLIDECWRHAKAIAAWDQGVAALRDAGIDGTPGVVAADSATAALTEVQQLLAEHRVWARFPATVS